LFSEAGIRGENSPATRTSESERGHPRHDNGVGVVGDDFCCSSDQPEDQRIGKASQKFDVETTLPEVVKAQNNFYAAAHTAFTFATRCSPCNATM
jgi:hypothetical protein